MSFSGNSAPLRVVFAGGGTAGHISPMIAMAQAVQEQQPDAEITMIGTPEGLETDLVPAAGFTLRTIPKVAMPRSLSPSLFSMPFRLRSATSQAQAILQEAQADVVVGVGGYASTPVYLAARKLRLPVVVHEANMRPGLANRVGRRFASVVGTAFADTPLEGAHYVGMPMRKAITQLDRSPESIATARLGLGLDPDRTTLVVTGGSSGALNINTTVSEVITDLTATGAQILHLTGRGKQLLDESGNLVTHDRYHQREYIDGLEHVYQAADLVIARSGAGTVCELAAVGLPSVLVPLPIGNGEQKLNGQPLVDAGAAVMVEDDAFTPDWARTHVVDMLTHEARLDYMAQKAYELGRRDAADVMAQHIIAQGRPRSADGLAADDSSTNSRQDKE